MDSVGITLLTFLSTVANCLAQTVDTTPGAVGAPQQEHSLVSSASVKWYVPQITPHIKCPLADIGAQCLPPSLRYPILWDLQALPPVLGPWTILIKEVYPWQGMVR